MGHMWASWALQNFSHLEINLETATPISRYSLTLHTKIIAFYHSSHYKPPSQRSDIVERHVVSFMLEVGTKSGCSLYSV